jgi:HD-GYP domain-containing protein (c-di-GMP phosphodiesterase class II)
MSSIEPNLSDITEKTIALMGALKQRDANTGEHSDRTQALALELGRAVALSSADLDTLRLAAHLHDVGKIGIPDAVLLKPGRLELDELQVMKTHAQRGHDILIAVPDEAIVAVAKVVLHHHEAFDGSGYPVGLKGEEIPVLARIISIADSYDAMATDRPYHHAKDHQVIMRILFDEQSHKYDPQLVKTFEVLIKGSLHKSKGHQANESAMPRR